MENWLFGGRAAMKTYTFAFFGEDVAQKDFLLAYLNQQYAGLFTENETFGWQIQAENKRDVDNGTKNAAFQGFTKFGLDVLFVGRDTDTVSEKKIAEIRNGLAAKSAGYKGKTAVLMMPVQCLEHWLWYLQWQRENPGNTKNISFETETRNDAKLKIYGPKNTAKTRVISREPLLQNLDVAWLESRSPSFLHFHKQVLAFLKTNSDD
jgi:hypothetical protein